MDVGLAGCPDEDVRAYAVQHQRILLTLDTDFANMLRFPPTGTPGVIRLKVHPPREDAIRAQIERTLARLRDIELAGCLVVVDGEVIRIRR